MTTIPMNNKHRQDVGATMLPTAQATEQTSRQMVADWVGKTPILITGVGTVIFRGTSKYPRVKSKSQSKV